MSRNRPTTREKPRSAKARPLARPFPWLPAIALFLLTMILYIPSMTNGFIWDDPQYIVDNPALKPTGGLLMIWGEPSSLPQYYPMVHTTFWIESQFWGTDVAAGYHVDNILLHALAAVLLWRALVKVKVPWPLLAAAVFAVHPVMVESVTWVTERKNVLSLVFYLLAFHAYFRSGLLNIPEAEAAYLPPPPWKWYIASLVFFLFALFSKTVTCSLPAAILLIIWWKRGSFKRDPIPTTTMASPQPRGDQAVLSYAPVAERSFAEWFHNLPLLWRDVLPLVPMLIIGLILSSVTSHIEHTQVGASGPDFDWTLLNRCMIAGHAICFYAIKLLWPHPLIFMYPKWDLHADLAEQMVYPVVAALVLLGLWIARRWIGRGPLVAVLFFIGTLVPALGFVNVYPMRYSFVADHFQYLASIGFLVLVVASIEFVVRRTGIPQIPARTVIAIVLLTPLAILTWKQQFIYKDAKTLWQNTIAQNETCWMAHINLAAAFKEEKNYDAAFVETRRGLELMPNEADTNYDYGSALAMQGKWQQAAEQFRKAIACDPNCAPAWSYLGRVLCEHGGDDPKVQAEALRDAQHALSLRSNLSDGHYVVARVAESRGNFPTAVTEYEKVVLEAPKNFAAHFNLGNCLVATGRYMDAASEYALVLNAEPNNAPAATMLGVACLKMDRRGDAIDNFHRALSIDPNQPQAKANLSAMGIR
jgi:Tfp pilus assembly protein PilF